MIERRYAQPGSLTAQPIRKSDPDGYRIGGYAARFDAPTFIGAENGGRGFNEVIRKGAFDKSLREYRDVRLLHSHDQGRVLGRTKAGTLSLLTDDMGLQFRAVLPPTAQGRETYVSIQRGDIDGMSFSFSVMPGGEDVSRGKDGKMLRELRAVKLHEVSVVAFPAYPTTSVGTSTGALDQNFEQNSRRPTGESRLRAQIEGKIALRERQMRVDRILAESVRRRERDDERQQIQRWLAR